METEASGIIRNAAAAGLNVSINTPLCSRNRDYRALLALGMELGVRYFTCSGLILTGGAETAESAATRLTAGELFHILGEGVEFANANGLDVGFTSPGWLSEEELQKYHITFKKIPRDITKL